MTDFFRIVLVFALILILFRRKVNLGLAMIVAAVAMGFLFRLAPAGLVEVAVQTVTDFATADLAIALVFILFLEKLMRQTLMLQKMVGAVTALSRDRRIAMALLPAFIGLLPSIGGAYFSAPMVEEASKGLMLSPERKSFINLWYRHLWEYVSPVYPSIILTAQILQVPLDRVISAQFPFTILAILVGIPIAFRGIDRGLSANKGAASRQHVLDLAVGLAPIVAIMVMVILLHINVSVSLVAAVAGVAVLSRYPPATILQWIREAFSPNLILLVVGIMLFKWMLTKSGAVDSLPAFFASVGIPVILVVFILPFAIGVMTGAAQAPVAIALPLVAGLAGPGVADVRLIAFAFVSAFAGVMLSPAHMCIVLTIQHFKADFGKVARLIVVPEGALVLAGALLYLVGQP